MNEGARPFIAERRPDVELMRVIAALMVITIHATSNVLLEGDRGTASGVTYWIALTAHAASRAGVPIFFAISGWLLLRRSTPGDVGWFKGRLTRMVVPLTVWSAIYVVDAVLIAGAVGRELWTQEQGPAPWLIGELARFLTGQGTRDHLWYLYFAVALSAAIWLIRDAHRNGRTILYAAVSGMLILPTAIAAGFGRPVAWEAFGWSIGYAALGYALLESEPRRRLGALAFVGGTIAVAAFTVQIGFNRWPAVYPSPFVALAPVGVIWLVASLRIPSSVVPSIQRAGALTLGVYLLHPLVLDVLRLAARPGNILATMPPSAQLAVTWSFTVVASFALVAAWHRVPGLRRLLG